MWDQVYCPALGSAVPDFDLLTPLGFVGAASTAMAETNVAVRTTPITPQPTTKMVTSLMAPTPQHQCTEAQNRRHPKTDERPLLPENQRETENRNEPAAATTKPAFASCILLMVRLLRGWG